ncbi:hypothetical protein ACIA8K_39830 [Catenuloplanes sp. NPDC051500]|uniref:hypothetical protein n=1 Tax=Catenuloplanes sp. NPDC051500 TaxID=3363959 RepID=UPI00379321FE
MPAEEPSLDARLDAARNDMLGRIDQPPLGALRARAHAHRARRRRIATAAVATLAVLTGGAVALRPQLGGNDTPDGGTPIAAVPVPASPSAPPSTVTGAGISLTGLDRDARVTDLPGRIGQVAFVDRQTGYLLNDCAGDSSCARTLARTTDGGRTWELDEIHTDLEITELNAFPGGTVVLSSATESLVSQNSGRNWAQVPDEGTSTNSLTAGDMLCRKEQGGAFKTAALSTGGRAVALSSQPAMDVRWVAPAASASGAWWVAGVGPFGKAAVAVTHDSGQSWKPAMFEVRDVGGISVAVRASEVYVLITGEGGGLTGVFHSTDGGGTFTPTRATAGAGDPVSVSGEAVPLPDGRLLIAGAGATWWVSSDHGATFTKLAGSLPAVGALRRTAAGWVADNLYGAGYVAFSTDGVDWQKLWIK